jgi:hypothetical protein
MKDLWIAEYERGLAEAEDIGLTGASAEEYAIRTAETGTVDRLADAADYARMLAKEGRQ